MPGRFALSGRRGMRAACPAACSARPTTSTIPSISKAESAAKNLALITVLGFSSGLPLALSGFTLRMWLPPTIWGWA